MSELRLGLHSNELEKLCLPPFVAIKDYIALHSLAMRPQIQQMEDAVM